MQNKSKEWPVLDKNNGGGRSDRAGLAGQGASVWEPFITDLTDGYT